MPRGVIRFGILLSVTMWASQSKFLLAGLLAVTGASAAHAQTPPSKPSTASASPTGQATPPTTATTPATPQTSAATPAQVNSTPVAPRTGLNVVVIDPAHGGTDAGGRGTEGIRESDVVLELATLLRKALEAQGFQVVQTRDSNDNPSFDDRSARANAQRGAVFVTLHVASTGVTGTARVYVLPEFAPVTDTGAMIQWDRAQAPFVLLSHKLGDLVQAELSKRFKGSPNAAMVAPVRQLRTTAAPAIAVELSSVSVADRGALARMLPGVAEAVARGITVFKPSYVVPTISSSSTPSPTAGGTQP